MARRRAGRSLRLSQLTGCTVRLWSTKTNKLGLRWTSWPGFSRKTLTSTEMGTSHGTNLRHFITKNNAQSSTQSNNRTNWGESSRFSTNWTEKASRTAKFPKMSSSKPSWRSVIWSSLRLTIEWTTFENASKIYKGSTRGSTLWLSGLPSSRLTMRSHNTMGSQSCVVASSKSRS